MIDAIIERLSSNQNFRYLIAMQKIVGMLFDAFMLVLGPCLITVVFGIVTGELYAFFTFLLPLHAKTFSIWWILNAVFAVYLAFSSLFNYVMCVTTNAGTHDSKTYKLLMLEAREAGHILSESNRTNGSVSDKSRIVQRNSNSRGGGGRGNQSSTEKKPKSWVDQGAFEWGYCKRTGLPKAPRAHFDHITKKLVLNMDHYCPWMFNVVGYLNYRYFVLFLFWIFVACVYGLCLTTLPFIQMVQRNKGSRYRLKMDFSVRSAVSYTFILALSIGLAVSLLFFWHVYLVLTSQTTIEFYGNQTKKFRARLRGQRYRNPYDMGMKRNWEHVFGHGHWAMVLLPSTKPPPWPPWPSLPHESTETATMLRDEHIV
uniref:Palmitoyltransferase n=1 Tax=Octactis speculum TaxID=3111310 RepID=A0A7S2FY83_9STRA|mmetsp:Transcript_33579/g.45363  ORF Transcript_33579/g.45363 Transcript_33579/m.45363 type:complete len:370 (+) Transcript_33579:104-1213(+)